MLGTYYVLQGDKYDLRIKDASPATTVANGKASIQGLKQIIPPPSG